MALPPKVCPDCREEYIHTAVVCVHCDVALVAMDEAGEAATPELPPAAELHCVRSAAVSWARSYSERLSAAGIPHRIELGEPAGASRKPDSDERCSVYVRPADAAAAAEVDAQLLRSQIPDLPDNVQPEAVSDDTCPACGGAVSAEAGECGSCGLVFVIE